MFVHLCSFKVDWDNSIEVRGKRKKSYRNQLKDSKTEKL